MVKGFSVNILGQKRGSIQYGYQNLMLAAARPIVNVARSVLHHRVWEKNACKSFENTAARASHIPPHLSPPAHLSPSPSSLIPHYVQFPTHQS